jgi:hypothetical protein
MCRVENRGEVKMDGKSFPLLLIAIIQFSRAECRDSRGYVKRFPHVQWEYQRKGIFACYFGSLMELQHTVNE